MKMRVLHANTQASTVHQNSIQLLLLYQYCFDPVKRCVLVQRVHRAAKQEKPCMCVAAVLGIAVLRVWTGLIRTI